MTALRRQHDPRHIVRGTGIVNNELFVGRRVWNRLRYVKAPPRAMAVTS